VVKWVLALRPEVDIFLCPNGTNQKSSPREVAVNGAFTEVVTLFDRFSANPEVTRFELQTELGCSGEEQNPLQSNFYQC